MDSVVSHLGCKKYIYVMYFDTLRKTYSRHHFTLTVHPNPLIRQIPLNRPLAIQHRRLERKRHTDILTQD